LGEPLIQGKNNAQDRNVGRALVLGAVVIGSWTLWVFWGSLAGGFVNLDTSQYVVDNEHIRSLSWENLRWMFTTGYASNWHPLTWLSHSFDVACYGLDARGHHLTNIVIHAVNAVAMFFLIFLLARQEPKLRSRALLGAGLAALLFALHPQRVESVTWIAERKDVLCQFFSTLTLILYALYAQPKRDRKRWLWMVAAIAAFVLALLSKPMAATLPAILLILDIYPLRRIVVSPAFRIRSDMRSCVVILLEKIPFLLLSAGSIRLSMWAQSEAGSVQSQNIVDVASRLINGAMAILLYLSKLLIPVHLSPFYPLFPITELRNPFGVLLALMMIVVISIQAVKAWWNGREYWLVAWLFFLITLSPVIGIVFIGVAGAADRYTYMATVPYCAIAGFALAYALERDYGRRTKFFRVLILCGCLIALGSLSWLTKNRVDVWKSDVTLWEDAVEVYPDSYIVWFYLGLAHKQAGDQFHAIEAFQHALTLETPEMQEWSIRRFQQDGKLSYYGHIYLQLGESYQTIGDAKNAIKMFRTIIDRQIPVKVSAALLHYNLAYLYYGRGELENATRELDSTYAIDPFFEDKAGLRKALSKGTASSAPDGAEGRSLENPAWKGGGSGGSGLLFGTAAN